MADVILFFTTLCSEDAYSSVVVFMTTFLLYWGVFLCKSVLVLSTTLVWEMRSEVQTRSTLSVRSIRSRMGPDIFWR